VTIRAILFDLGNTVLEYSLTGHWREFLRQRLAQIWREAVHGDTRSFASPFAKATGDEPLRTTLLSRGSSGEDVDTAAGEFAQKVGDVIGGAEARAIEHSGRSWPFRERLRAGLAAVGVSADAESIERLTDLFYEPIHACNKPYPDTAETLARLRAAGLALAIITNAPWDTPARLLRGDLEQWDCAHFFDAFVCSGEVPWRKPNPRFMIAAAEALGMSADECLVVGDTLDVDIAGANAAHMRSVWINPTGEPAPLDAARPDWVAQSIGGVPKIARLDG
jgi:HAD superfamily hydrolase (TIGR01509 family)